MSEKSPAFHDTTAQAIEDISNKARVPENREFSITDQEADIDHHRVALSITRSEGGYTQESTHVQLHRNPVDTNGVMVQPSPRPVAELGSTMEHDGTRRSRATAAIQQSEYFAVEDSDGKGKTRVERAGYGSVEIKNPRAKELVAKLAAKTIQKAQTDIQEVKGTEHTNEHAWIKKTRRAARRMKGKKTQTTV